MKFVIPSAGIATPVSAANGGTGVANNAASTLTISGNFGTTFTVSGVTTLTLPTSGTLATVAGTLPITGGTLTGHLLFTDNTYDIGASGATRPRAVYVGTSVTAPTITVTTKILVPQGSDAAPGIANSSTTNTGMQIAAAGIYFNIAGTNQVGITANALGMTQGFGQIIGGSATNANRPVFCISDTNSGIGCGGSTNSVALVCNNADVLIASTTNGLALTKTITAGGTTGAQTINKITGSVNFAAAATSLVVTNSLVTANSVIHCTLGTNDTTAVIGGVVAGSGSFTINMRTAPTAETRVNFLITN